MLHKENKMERPKSSFLGKFRDEGINNDGEKTKQDLERLES